MEANYLSFEDVQPLIEVSFWLKFTQLKLDDSKRDTDESELPDQIEDVDLVVDDRLSRASTPVFYLGSDA